MAAKRSAGILLYRRRDALEVLLIHPGGPFWRHKDAGAWMIPKGEVHEGEEPLACAMREFKEELGSRPAGAPVPLGEVKQAGGKWVTAFALEGDINAEAIVSNHFTIEHPAESGAFKSFPEVDRAAWLPLAGAREKILKSQLPLLDRLEALLS